LSRRPGGGGDTADRKKRTTNRAFSSRSDIDSEERGEGAQLGHDQKGKNGTPRNRRVNLAHQVKRERHPIETYQKGGKRAQTGFRPGNEDI